MSDEGIETARALSQVLDRRRLPEPIFWQMFMLRIGVSVLPKLQYVEALWAFITKVSVSQAKSVR